MVELRPSAWTGCLVACLATGCLGSGDIHVITGVSGSSEGSSSTTGDEYPESTTTGGEPELDDPFDLPKLDVAAPTWTDPPLLPTNCLQSHLSATHSGCLFYPFDLDRTDPADPTPTWVVVVNPHADTPMHSTLFQRLDNEWTELEPEAEVAAGSYHVYTLPQQHIDGSGWFQGGAFRLRTNLPATVYQFSGVDAFSLEGSASTLLLPLSAWSSNYHVLGWQTHSPGNIPSYVATIGHHSGTVVSMVPSAQTLPGNLLAGGGPQSPLSIALNDGDVTQVAVAESSEELDYGLTGSVVQSGGEHPIALFTAHACASVPDEEPNCNHIQEQLSPYLYGTHFVAPPLPPRDPDNPEATLWQLYALENSTSVEIVDANNSSQELVLKAGETFELWHTGNGLEISTSREIAVAGYVTNHADKPSTMPIGGPEIFTLSPTTRWLDYYAVFTLPGWERSYAVVARAAGSEVALNGEVVDDELFAPAGEMYEFAAIPLADGMAHILTADEPFLVVSLGYGQGSAYASLAGWGTQRPAHEPIP